ncbi:MAG: hypothetical protein PHS95_02480 [Candidatus Pacebacteria bacterium]|nr:hypothetical protein [Candidatus Paceibacterota bacterium]
MKNRELICALLTSLVVVVLVSVSARIFMYYHESLGETVHAAAKNDR